MTEAAGTAATRRARQRTTAATPPVSAGQRAELGKAARVRVPRERHALTDFPADRLDPVSLLEQQDTSRIPGLAPLRYGRMLASPFGYFRGAALPMAADLARTPVTGLTVQACGDAHLANFGFFGSPERRLVFDVSDFDETLPAPWEWDVKRLAASLEVAGRENGFSRKQREAIVLAAADRYRETMRRFAGASNLQVWYARAHAEQLRARLAPRLSPERRRARDRGEASARPADSVRSLAKLTRTVNGAPRIIPDPPRVVPVADLAAGEADPAGLESQLQAIIERYAQTLETDRRQLAGQYRLADAARKVAGVASVGTRCWITLLLGRDATDLLFLQVKEAQPSVLAAFAGPSEFPNQGQRVAAGQRLTQAASDIFLGWYRSDAGTDGEPRDFYVRQLRDRELPLDAGTMTPDGMRLYGQVCGWTLARAHARSGDRIAIAAYLGSSAAFARAITEFAAAYADQNERDHRALADAAAAGRVTARSG